MLMQDIRAIVSTGQYSDPAAARRALDLLADVVGDYLQVQIDAGAAAVQIFDTWAGALSPEARRRLPEPIAAFLDQNRAVTLDVDADGSANALTDGLLILRRLFVFAGVELR